MIRFKHMVKMTEVFVKTHKSEIATAAGLALEGATVALTVKATIKATHRATDLRKRLDALWDEVEAMEEGPEREMRQEELEKTEKKEIRLCARDICKSYIWPAITFAGSVFCFVFSVHNARKEIRNLSAALAAETALSNWRKKKAKEILTEDQYNELYYGLKKSGKTREDKNGNEIEVYEFCNPEDNNFDAVIGPQKIAGSKYAMYLTPENCLNEHGIGFWCPHNPDYNRARIVQRMEWANDTVLHDGVVTNNEIYKQCEQKQIDECANLGIVFKPERGKSQVQYEIIEVDDPNYNDICFFVDFNYENIEGKINQAIIDLNKTDYKNVYE
ncbi:MAG: hypothetical protein J6U54_13315 [Clostridiales bacterium]|nr:hypothetical protein [Clostridiales bacterium]